MAYFGLTGGAGTGKTTVARLLEELGARVIDADRIGHELLFPSSRVYAQVVRRFGEGILDSAGEIARPKLGAIVFSDPEQLAALNKILHPEIIREVELSEARYSAKKRDEVIVVDAALILEAGIGGHFVRLIATWCRPEQQLERLMAKLGLTREQAERRVAAQMSADEKRARADFVVDTSGSLDETRRQVVELYPQLQKLVAGGAA
jgi:dephospho-CoA kinase